MQKAPSKPEPRKAALAFIFVVVMLDVMAIGIIIPVLPKLVESMAGGNTGRAAEIYGVFGTAWGLMQFVFSPILGGRCRTAMAGGRCCSSPRWAWASITS